MIVIQDDFYPNPEEIREKALEEFFTQDGNKKIMFPGQRTISTFSNENFVYLKNRLQHILNRKAIWFPKKNSNTDSRLVWRQKTILIGYIMISLITAKR